MDLLAERGLDVPMLAEPYGVPAFTTPFPQDEGHASYDPEAVRRYHGVLLWAGDVLEEFAGWFCGKTSPVHLFWHSFDLAVTRFSGRRAPARPDADGVSAEAYSHEVVSFGFWAGDRTLREPAFYAYAAPEPPGLADRPLHPAAARWTGEPGGHLALLPYEDVRTAASPRAALLDFLESAYQAGAGAAGWDLADLASHWCPLDRLPPSRPGSAAG
jgi:hypothetical protein